MLGMQRGHWNLHSCVGGEGDAGSRSSQHQLYLSCCKEKSIGCSCVLLILVILPFLLICTLTFRSAVLWNEDLPSISKTSPEEMCSSQREDGLSSPSCRLTAAAPLERCTPSAFVCVRQRIKTALAGILGLGSLVLVTGQESLTTLNANVSFLESGLTTLGVLSAAVTVLARADLAYESMLRDWQYTVMDTGSEGHSRIFDDLLMVSNIKSKTLSLLTTRLWQGAGSSCAIGTWKQAHLDTDPPNNLCACIFVTCSESCIEQLGRNWSDQVIHYKEDCTQVILYGSNCWTTDRHWQWSADSRDRISEEAINARQQVPAPPLVLGVQYLLNILDDNGPDIGALVISLDDAHNLARMMREEFTCRDEASRNKRPLVLEGLLDRSDLERELDEDRQWNTSRWRCLFLHIIEIIVMVALTLIFTIDPFTTSLAARRVVASFVASESGSAPYAGHFVDRLTILRAKAGSLKHTYVLRVPPVAGISYLVVMTLNLLIWLLCVGFWLGRVAGGIPAIVYQSGLYQQSPGVLLWTFAGLSQAIALISEVAMRSNMVLIPLKTLKDVWKLMKYSAPKVEICTAMLVVVGIAVPTLLGASKEVLTVCCVGTMWVSAVITWGVSIYHSPRHIYNTLPPTTQSTLYYASAFFKLAALTAGSGTWR